MGSLGELLRRLRGPGSGALLARGTAAFLSIHLLGLAAGFAASVAIARVLGAERYGVYVLALAWIAVLRLPCQGGFATGAIRFVAALRATEEWGLMRGFLRTSRRYVVVASLAVGGAAAAGVAAAGERISPELAATLLVGCASLPFFALLELWSSTLRGFLRVASSQLPIRLVQPLLLVAFVVAWHASSAPPLDAPRVAGLNLASGALAALLAGLSLLRAIPPPARAAAVRTRRREWARTAAPLLLIASLHLVMERTDVLLLGFLRGPLEAGLYAPASRLAALIALGLVAVNAWVGPMISALHARGELGELQLLVRRGARAIALLTLPAAVGVVVLGRPLLGLFGAEFVAAHPALVILVLGSVANALTGSVGILMTMTGRQDAAAGVLLLWAGLNLGLNLVLIPRYGIVGAAISSAVTTAGWNVHLAVIVWRSLGLRTTAL